MKKEFMILFAFFAAGLMLLLPVNFFMQGRAYYCAEASPSINLFDLSNLSEEEIFVEFLNISGVNTSELTAEDLVELYDAEVLSTPLEETIANYLEDYGVNLSNLSQIDLAKETKLRINDSLQVINENTTSEIFSDEFIQTAINISEQADIIMDSLIAGGTATSGGNFSNLLCLVYRSLAMLCLHMAAVALIDNDEDLYNWFMEWANLFNAMADTWGCPPLNELFVYVSLFNINTYLAHVDYLSTGNETHPQNCGFCTYS